MKQITPNLYLIKMPQADPRAPQVNVYFLKNEKLLIDAGPDNYSCYLNLQQCLNKIGINLQQISVVLTHHHPDHIGLLKYFPHEIPIYANSKIQYYGTNAYLIAIENQVQGLRSVGVPEHAIQQIKFQLKKRYLPFLTTIVFKDFKYLTASTIQIHHFNGHSSSDVVFQKGNYFFGGDLILKGIYFNTLLDIEPTSQKLQLLNQEYQQNINSILTTFNIQAWCPGHGNVMDYTNLIKVTQKHQQLREIIHQKIRQSFSFANYDESIREIYSYFPRLSDYFYLSDILTEIK